MMSTVYEIVTESIIKKLEEGTIPWRKPWVGESVALRWKKQEPYRGINQFLLPSGEYATYKQIKEAGGRIKKGEGKNYSIAVFWKWNKKKGKKDEENEEDTNPSSRPLLRYYRVYEINTQCEGLESKRGDVSFEHAPVEEAEKLIKDFMNKPGMTYNPGSAFYLPSMDVVNVPPMKHFPNIDEFYATCFHELVHSTGHKSRLNRPGIVKQANFGDEVYSKEELVAELGASMLSAIAGIDNSTFENSASYLKGWLGALKGDSRLIVQASAQAQKAVDYIRGVKYEN
nr:zincin-like metallopeptidase domain-containing protein [Bacillus thuringiensis]